MTSKRTPRYTDDFRAGALELLRAAGYDFDQQDRPGNWAALNRTAQHLKMPEGTLRGWAKQSRRINQPRLRQYRREELVDAFIGEIGAALGRMNDVRDDAHYKDLATTIGILTDKLQLLTGEPTANNNTKIIIEYSDEASGYDVDLADAIEVATAGDQRGETL